MFLRNNLIIIFLFIFSCQPVELLQPLQIDYSKFKKIDISAKEISINTLYNPIFSQENIEDQILNPPLQVVLNWSRENISNIGKENKFIINIIDASISKKQIEDQDAKNFQEKTIFKYTVSFLVEYELYDDSGFLLANVSVECSRSTTSKKYISINETEIIISDLVNIALKDFTEESTSLLTQYMGEYLSS
tara:strand:+ start:197 stop:769 length:573 start_codon:yes stop_codon:yes gene_type:complete